MELPCITCKYRTEREVGHRKFIGCVDPERKKRGFKEDDYLYRHKCTEFVKEEDNAND